MGKVLKYYGMWFKVQYKCENNKTSQSMRSEWSRGSHTKKVRTVPLMNWLHIKQYLTEGPQSVHVHRCPQGRNTTETRLVLHFRQYTDFRSCVFSFSATSSCDSVTTIRNNTVDFMSFISIGLHRCDIKQLLTFLFLYFDLLHNSILYVEN